MFLIYQNYLILILLDIHVFYQIHQKKYLHIYKNKILFVLFEQLLIKIVKRTDKQILNLESEEKKLELASTGLSRLISI